MTATDIKAYIESLELCGEVQEIVCCPDLVCSYGREVGCGGVENCVYSHDENSFRIVDKVL